MSRITYTFSKKLSEEELEKMNRLDVIDDILWDVILGLNTELEVGLDIESSDHTSLIIESRESILEVLMSFKQDSMR